MSLYQTVYSPFHFEILSDAEWAMVSSLMPPLYDTLISVAGGPVPRQKLVEPVDSVIVDPGEHVGEPGSGIDVVELGRVNQRQHDRGALAATNRAGEQPRLPAEGNSAQLALGRIVAQANAPIVEETPEMSRG